MALREALAKAGAVEELFDPFDGVLKGKGYLAMASAGSARFSPEGKKEKREGREGGQIIRATAVPAPKQHNSREENETIKDGKTAEDWKQKPTKNRPKDMDARAMKKHERSYFGYKNHSGTDRRHKFVRRDRARRTIAMTNFVSNIRRFVCLERMAPAAR